MSRLLVDSDEMHIPMEILPDREEANLWIAKVLNEVKEEEHNDISIKLDSFIDSELARREELLKLRDRLSDEITHIEENVKRELSSKSAKYGYSRNYNVSWVETTSQRIDAKRLKLENPELYKFFLKQSISKHFSVKKRVA